MIKADLTTSINSINDGGSNTASEVRTVYNNINDTFYGSSINDTNASTNVVTEVATNKPYSLNFTKQGGLVNVQGFVRNNTGAITGLNELFCNITTTEYEQLVSSTYYVTGFSASTSEPLKFILTTNTFAALDSLGVNELVEFNFNYKTNA